MPYSYRADGHFQFLPSSQNSGHFLPSLTSHQPSSQKYTSSQHQQQMLSSSLPSSSHFTMVHSDDVDKKKDRKSIARRQLVETLSSAQNTLGMKGLRRTQSCNYSTPPHASHIFASRSGLSPDSRDATGHGKSPWGRQRTLITHNVSVEKAREAIENWNDLVLELHSEQYRQQLESHRHLAVLSDTSSDGGVSSPAKDSKAAKSGLNTQVKKEPSLLHITNAKYPSGLGFTKYRPITPNLLLRLDKQKLPPRKRTQLWVNQLPDQRRSHHGPTISEEQGPEACEHVPSATRARASRTGN